jgi:Transglutaminase-like superfamily
VDLALLMERGALERGDLLRHARALGCPRTLALFLQQCEPSLNPSIPRKPTRLASLRWKVTAAWEGGFVTVPNAVLRVLRAPALAWDIARILPLLVAVRSALRRHRDVRQVLERLTPAPAVASRTSPRRRWRTVRAIHWACRLLPVGPAAGRCLPRALAIYTALRRQGWNVEFVSGVSRDQNGLHGHAWVDEDGVLLRELRGWERLPDYRANLRYPPPA